MSEQPDPWQREREMATKQQIRWANRVMAEVVRLPQPTFARGDVVTFDGGTGTVEMVRPGNIILVKTESGIKSVRAQFLTK